MDQEEDYLEDNNNEEGEKNETEDIYDDLTEENKDLKSHSPKKRWKERHSGISKDSNSYHRSPRRNSGDRSGRGNEEENVSHRSSDASDHHHHHHRRRSDEHSDDSHEGTHRKSSRQYDDEDRYLKSKQKKLKEKLRKIEAEDGEILEDGEIEEGEEPPPKKSDSNTDVKKLEREISEKTDASFEYNEESGGEVEDEDNQDDESSKRRDKRRKHRDHGRDKRRKSRDDHHKKRKRRTDYVDHDKVNDDEMQQSWLGGSKKQSPKGSRRQDNNHSSYGSHGKRDRKKQRYHSPPGPYDSPYDSPPGPYDSPSYDEDSQEEYQDEGYDDYKEDFKDRRKQKSKKKSMMSLMQGDDYLDPNVAIDEGENVYKKRDGIKKQKQKNFNKRKFDRQHSEQQPPKKKPLLETPMDERPICRFYKEGKCHKGSDCPFNHEVGEKKPELCKYYLGGSCSKGDNCIFMHSEYPCKFFHTGQECYQGDNCKFSHDEPSDETIPIVERMKSRDHHDHGEDEEFGRKRPGVLGSPPRHLKEQMERIKKIPSLFDIQTFPPGQSPQKPPQQGGQMNSPQQRMQGPNQGQPQRPMGFYNDTMQGGMRGPPPMGPQGPMNRPLGQMGPQGPGMSGPGQMGPPMGGPQGHMNMPPNSMGLNVPPNSMGMGGPMGGPMMQQGPMQGPMTQGVPMSQGQMGGPPMGQGPPIMNQPGMMGPQGPIAGPQRMNNPNLNPALAIVGALLRHVNPQMAPQVSQVIGVQGGMQDPRQGTGMLSPKSLGSENQDPRQGFKSPPLDMNQDEAYSPRDEDQAENNKNIKIRNKEMSEGGNEEEYKEKKIKTEEKDENEKKLALMGLDLGSLSQLPAKQRELMMRLQQHGNQPDGEQDKANAIKRERKDSASSEDIKLKSKVDDDKWYSSDEEEGDTPKLTDVLKNLGKKEATTTEVSSSSAINVMQMINAIKSQSGPTTLPVPARDPRQRMMDPRTVSHGDPGGFPHPADPRTFTSGLTVPPVNKSISETAIINSRPGDAEWRCIRVTVDSSRRTEPPQGINILNPPFKDDPRIKKFLDDLNMKSHKENKNPHEPSFENKPMDPRSKPSALLEGPKDPRLKKPGEPSAIDAVKPMDPRLQRTISENASSRVSDPRMRGTNPPSGVHNLPVRPVDPRSSGSLSKSTDPRFSRQLSHDISSSHGTGSNMVLNVPKPSDPRLLPISLGEIASPSPSDILASLSYPTDSLNEQKSDITGFNRQNSVKDSKTKPSLEYTSSEQNVEQYGNLGRQVSGGSDSESGSSQSGDASKAKIDYRNDPRFKVKIKPACESTQRRYGGQRKGSMEYSSPLDAESEQRDNSGGYNSYNRPATNNPKPPVKQEPRTQRIDPRFKNDSESLSVPQLPDFIPPEEENISTKHFFKQMDPTASPFC